MTEYLDVNSAAGFNDGWIKIPTLPSVGDINVEVLFLYVINQMKTGKRMNEKMNELIKLTNELMNFHLFYFTTKMM